MNLFDKYNCILCKYNKYNKNGDNCYNHREKDEYGYPLGKCMSLSNIYYGKIIKWFPFNVIDKIASEILWKRADKYYKDFNEDCTENNDMKFIFGVMSWDDLSSATEPNLLTMNDFDLIYLKDEKKYILSIETAYKFKDKQSEKEYLQELLNKFTKWMQDNGFNTDSSLNSYGDMFEVFTDGININTHFNTIEDAYRTFKLLVNGYLTL